MCAKNHLLIFSSFQDIWENVVAPFFWSVDGGMAESIGT